MTALMPVSVFYSYAHEDEALRDELAGHLRILERRGLVSSWHDRRIDAGADWSATIDRQLKMADLVLLLVSTDFVNSDYIFGSELTVAMQRHAAGVATVVPILVRAVNIEAEDADAFPFMKLQGLPTDLRPVTSWTNRDEAWTNVAKGLRATVKIIHDKKAAARSAGAMRGGVRGVLPSPPPATAATSEPKDPVLTRILDGFTSQMREATDLRGGRGLDDAALRTDALSLIDEPDQKRVLWVDDHPGNNRHEAAALAKLQIDVHTVQSTGEALDAVARDAEGFDLVISDWDRPQDGASAGLHLLARLREIGSILPFVFYHGASEPDARRRRAEEARAGGAVGEAVYPAELMPLVLRALRAATAG